MKLMMTDLLVHVQQWCCYQYMHNSEQTSVRHFPTWIVLANCPENPLSRNGEIFQSMVQADRVTSNQSDLRFGAALLCIQKVQSSMAEQAYVVPSLLRPISVQGMDCLL